MFQVCVPKQDIKSEKQIPESAQQANKEVSLMVVPLEFFFFFKKKQKRNQETFVSSFRATCHPRGVTGSKILSNSPLLSSIWRKKNQQKDDQSYTTTSSTPHLKTIN
jgi:hypothetical protein